MRIRPEKQDRVEEFLRGIVRVGLASESLCDWNRFYRFIALAHAHRKRWNHQDVKQMLVQYGIPERQAKMFSEVYWHGRCVLYNVQHFSSRRPRCADWVRQDGGVLT
jgi:HD superfamily phosphohydrolase YqeK